MTFYEAAIQILTRAGRPLHAREITEIAIAENLLSHVGKQPEQTMASRLAAMARRSHDRRLVAVEPDTFGLVDWNLPAPPEALEASGLREVHDETEPPLRGRERHPRISRENVRIAGRGDRRRREEGERKKKRLAPTAQLVYEFLERIGRPVVLLDLLSTARENELVAGDVGSEAVETLLRAENERREADGRRPVFEFHEGGFVGIRGRHGVPEAGGDLASLVSAAGRDLALERAAPKQIPAAVPPPAPLLGTVAQFLAEARQRAVQQLRRRLCELDSAGVEAVAQLAIDAMGYRDSRIAKRGREGALFVARRRMGLVELRFCIRAIRGGRELRRADVIELRRELTAQGAQIGVLLSPADVSREARSEAMQSNAPVVLLLCADALADQLVEKGIGVVTRMVTVAEFDETAFATLRREERPGEERTGERKERDAARREREERRRAREERRESRAAARATPRSAGESTAISAGSTAEGPSVQPPPLEGTQVQLPGEFSDVPTATPPGPISEANLPEEPLAEPSPLLPLEPEVSDTSSTSRPPAGPSGPSVSLPVPCESPGFESESGAPDAVVAHDSQVVDSDSEELRPTGPTSGGGSGQ